MFVLKPSGTSKTTVFTTIKQQAPFFAYNAAFFLTLRGAYAFFSRNIEA